MSMLRASMLLTLIACGSSSNPSSNPTWQRITESESSALLAIWGSSSDDVWAVGGRTSASGGPTILHYDGAAWSRVDSQQTNLDLWWVVGLSDGDVLFSGSGGTILRYHEGAFRRLTTPNVTATIFGMWAAAPNDIWAVGVAGTAGGAVWRSTDGETFTEVPLPTPVPNRVFKVHGRSSNDVWMSCSNGLTLRWDGNSLVSEQTPTLNSLFSVITTPELAVTVGGTGGVGDLLENNGSGWTQADLSVPAAWRGTAAVGDDVVVVGESGLVAERVGSSWKVLRQELTIRNFHSAWLDEDGGLWAVGGLFEGRLSDGVLLYYGDQTIAEVSQ